MIRHCLLSTSYIGGFVFRHHHYWRQILTTLTFTRH